MSGGNLIECIWNADEQGQGSSDRSNWQYLAARPGGRRRGAGAPFAFGIRTQLGNRGRPCPGKQAVWEHWEP